MTTPDPKDGPTQAQIEAAAKAIERVRRCGRFSSCEELAEAALTAATEAGEATQAQIDKAHDVWKKQTAEAGDDWVSEIDRKGAELAAAHIKDTVERCAQIADKWDDNGRTSGGDIARAIAAEIRAMKE